jgi:YVTN family beta-propeller protein
MRLSTALALFAGGAALAAAVVAGSVAPAVRLAHIRHPQTGAPLTVPGKDGDATLLFNGWKISPVGNHIPTGDMVIGGAFSPDGKTLAIVNAGFGAHALHIVDVASERQTDTLMVGRAWNGIAWSPDGKTIYVSGGVSTQRDDVHVVKRSSTGAWEKTGDLTVAAENRLRICIAGLALSRDGRTLFILNNSDDQLYVLDAVSGATVGHVPVGDHPYACKLSHDGRMLYVCCLGGSEVVAVDVHIPQSPSVRDHVATGEHPNDLVLSLDDRLYVSCANSDAVSVFDLRTQHPLETIKTTLTPRSPSGSTPVALSLTPDERTLYVANADNNDVCVVNVSRRGRSRVVGFIPTGWYPTAVLVTPDGKHVVIGSGKGIGTKPNPSPRPVEPPLGFQYIAFQLNGMISFVDAPSQDRLAAYTSQVVANTPYSDELLRNLHPDRRTVIPAHVGDPCPIKHILYIIKENRTYDQVFGDMGKGNSDPNLCYFGQDVSPNHHALAEQFVLLDNLYCNGEVSQDGHPWSDSAACTDFNQKAWVLSYSGKGHPAQSDSVNDPHAGFIWQACAKRGLTYRAYGEHVPSKSLEGHSCEPFRGKMSFGEAPPGRDMARADIFIKEFKEFEKTHTVPNFMVMSLGEDHTHGTAVGAFTPKATVASNDQALGKIVETISHSSLWREFAIFVIEDDAQNGPDHVDSHRTVALVISPWTRHHAVDSTMYSTVSMLRTMELILGLKPLTQYDAAASPMFNSFDAVADLRPYNLIGPRINLNERNGRTAYGAAESSKMDFRGYDRVDEQALNRILWHSIKGADVPMPPPVHRAILSSNGSVAQSLDDDDDHAEPQHSSRADRRRND